ncbi:tetratricopeptide repeat protein [Phaeobacter inhibens]|uniref:tetratricopeptide repeat protein n=1 Tax=Phaeobacter inhibens TaxID=221822 RepID=UPI0026E1B8D8|nr:tetratricopeptide repeat protein [Phaeobacter inhibens]MDO6755407.1 tetratricopeptide repeat protein [Phaeobacter inhibens]
MRQFLIAPFLGLGFAAAASLAQAEGAGRAPSYVDGASCPAAPDHQGAVDQLIGRVQAAPDEASAQQISNQFWQYWADAPNAEAQALLDRGMTRRSAFDFLGALEAFDRLVAYCPDYAEGYNQRAFVHYLRRDFAAALRDLDRALDLSPRHVAALSGRALSLYGLSRLDEAREALDQALSLNPWLPERYLVAPGGPLAPEDADAAMPEVEL